ncbi:MAG: hypothetical protein JJD92_07320 [Frankiaceae bacterium]|nr:hypothetical protein [Frankiaceae bacterium]
MSQRPGRSSQSGSDVAGPNDRRRRRSASSAGVPIGTPAIVVDEISICGRVGDGDGDGDGKGDGDAAGLGVAAGLALIVGEPAGRAAGGPSDVQPDSAQASAIPTTAPRRIGAA